MAFSSFSLFSPFSQWPNQTFGGFVYPNNNQPECGSPIDLISDNVCHNIMFEFPAEKMEVCPRGGTKRKSEDDWSISKPANSTNMPDSKKICLLVALPDEKRKKILSPGNKRRRSAAARATGAATTSPEVGEASRWTVPAVHHQWVVQSHPNHWPDLIYSPPSFRPDYRRPPPVQHRPFHFYYSSIIAQEPQQLLMDVDPEIY